MTELPTRLRSQADQCLQHGSPLLSALLTGAAADYEAAGPTYDLLRPHADDPSGSVPSLRLMGALHRLVLQRKAPALALHYPSVGGTAGIAGAWEAAQATVSEHLDELREGVRRPVQTNEVGRSAALYGALLQLGGPIRLLEVGASAGLNLLVDRFAYEVSGQVLGDPLSPVRLREPWGGRLPSGAVEVVARAGCDPEPLDPSSAHDRLTLTSYIWADQVERFERLRAALQVAERHGVAVEQLSASEFLQRELTEAVEGVTTVVWHSVVRQYLAPGERQQVQRLIAQAGERATRSAPLAHLSLEPDRIGGGPFRYFVELTTWPGGRTRVLAEAMGHGPPVVWT